MLDLDSMLIEGEGPDLYLAFSGLPGDFGMPDFEFRKTLSAFEGRKIFFRDLHQAWYLCGLDDKASSYSKLRDMLFSLLEKEKPARLITIGVSSGGFASLLFGKVLSADRALAFGPQTFVDLFTRNQTGELRWGYRLPYLYSHAEPDAPMNLKQVLGPEFPAGHVWYSSTCQKDRPHIDNIRIEGITFYEIEGELPTGDCDSCMDICSVHNVAGCLKQRGELESEIRGVL